MRRVLLLAGLAAASLALGACSTSTANKVVSATQAYDNAVLNFQAAAKAVDGSIALTSATVGPYCTAAEKAGQNLAQLASGSSAAATALNVTAAALTTYCNEMPQDIQGAVVALTDAAVQAKKAAGG